MLHLIQEQTASNLWDEKTNQFVVFPSIDIRLEHSLHSISKWEEEYCKPFASDDGLTMSELSYYAKCMDLDDNTRPIEYYIPIAEAKKDQIQAYLNSNRTATRINASGSPKRRIITCELIYCWMAHYGIPFECDRWNYSKLMTLIEVCNIEGQEEKPMSKSESMARHKQINEMNRKKYFPEENKDE